MQPITQVNSAETKVNAAQKETLEKEATTKTTQVAANSFLSRDETEKANEEAITAKICKKDLIRCRDTDKVLAATSPGFFYSTVYHHYQPSQDVLFEYARQLILSKTYINPWWIQQFGVKDESRRIELAKLLATEDPSLLAATIKTFAITQQDALVELAKELATRLWTFDRFIPNFEVKDEADRVTIAAIFVVSQSVVDLKTVQESFNITTEEMRKKFAGLLFNSGKRAIAQRSICNLADLSVFAALDTGYHFKLIRCAVAADASCAAEYLSPGRFMAEDFSQERSFDRTEINPYDHFLVAVACHPDSLTDATLSNLSTTHYLRAYIDFMLHPESGLKSVSVPKDSPLLELLEQIHKIQPGKAAVAAHGTAEAQRHEQKILLRWFGYVLLCCQIYRPDSDQLRTFLPVLRQILAMRNPQMRYPLTYLLISQIVSGASDVQEIATKVAASLKHAHSQLFVPLLSPLIAAEQKKDFSTLVEVVDRSAYFTKSTTNQMDVIKSLSTILQNNVWSREQQSKLLRIIFPVSGYSEEDQKSAKLQAHHLAQRNKSSEEATKAKALADRLQKEAKRLPTILHKNLQAVAQLMQLGGQHFLTEWLNTKHEATFSSAAEFSKNASSMMTRFFSERFGIEMTSKEASTSALFPARRPTAVLTYAGTLNTLPAKERGLTLPCLKSLLERVLNGTYGTHRYDVTSNTHLKQVFEGNDKLRKIWEAGERIPFAEFSIQKYLGEQCVKDKCLHSEGMIVEDTDDFQDMLLIGTDVNSCQSVSKPESNRALLAYIIDGKIRAIVVKNQDGRILARRILRILWDPVANTPTLLQERTYYVNQTPMEIRLAVDAMCIRRAQALGLTLVEEAAESSNRLAYRNPLHSLGSPAPYEYVDTAGLGFLDNPSYTIPASNLQVVWSGS